MPAHQVECCNPCLPYGMLLPYLLAWCKTGEGTWGGLVLVSLYSYEDSGPAGRYRYQPTMGQQQLVVVDEVTLEVLWRRRYRQGSVPGRSH